MTENNEELENISGEYLKPTADRQLDQEINNMVCNFVIPRISGRRILELGVGDQIWTPKLLDSFSDVTSVDGSTELLANMKAKLFGKPWTPVSSLFEEYNPVEGFDAVLATYVLEHVDDPLLILKLARKWLKEKGQLAVVVPHALSLHRRLAVKLHLARYSGELGETDRRLGHKHCFAWYEMEKHIVDAGFRVLEKYGMFSKPLPNSMLVNLTRDQLRGMFELGIELPIEYSSIIYFLAEAEGK